MKGRGKEMTTIKAMAERANSMIHEIGMRIPGIRIT